MVSRQLTLSGLQLNFAMHTGVTRPLPLKPLIISVHLLLNETTAHSLRAYLKN